MYMLPLFPLNSVLFPGTPIYLHIFEPRYRLMIRECLENNQPFGVVLIHQGVEALGPLAKPHSVGCSARIVDYEKLEDGKMNLVAMGDERFKILEMDWSKPYLVGKVETVLIEQPHTLQLQKARRPFEKMVRKYTGKLREIGSTDFELDEIQFPEDTLALLYLSAALLQIPATEKQTLLVAKTSGELLTRLWRLYRRETAVLSHLNGISELEATRAAWLN